MAVNAGLPRLQRTRGGWELVVDGKPFLILGAELHNSSMSSVRYTRTVWKDLVDAGINTVLGAVAWGDIEPEEGNFDFSILDQIIPEARRHGLRLILLWFGSFKNGKSSYAPSWIKTDPLRFPRMYIRNQAGQIRNSGVLSVFHEQCMQADAKAFVALLRHINRLDTERTVVMIQVENEVGLLGDSRDRSLVATNLFKQPVPHDLVSFLRDTWETLPASFTEKFTQANLGESSCDWEGLLGESIYTDELFMAYHYALYLESIASAGRKAYDIPLFTNVWQPDPGDLGAAAGGGKPGEYPSGGAVSDLLHIWQRFTPSLCLIAPDIYTAHYPDTCASYSRNQPLLIPEQRRDEYGARRVWAAIGNYQALGASPFGIDSQRADQVAYKHHYKLLGSVSKHILNARRDGKIMTGFFFDELTANGDDPSPPLTVCFSSYKLTISRAFVLGKPGPGYGIVIESGPSKFLLVGKGFKVQFESIQPRSEFTGILTFEEMAVSDGENQELVAERRLNGDETFSGEWANMPNDNPDYGAAVIPISIPARTGIAQVEVFTI